MPPLALRGVVTKVGLMQKTATVLVSRWATHQFTGKRMERSKKYLTHDPHGIARKDDVVVIRNCPPVSKLKRFKLETVLRSPEKEREAARAKADAKAAAGDVVKM
ncbi:Polyamine transporter 1 [Mycena kentingensis (nom. inval.)]|nr:Polyamine transporter 1 [Mycena kentingensis (nom. inval.)]